ncbi:MBOAT family O-acyltransferase [uncultured Kordia sp.]|uniref:MBOAT family O-acyltransferase n=1 Tax=uncultured Kordia sp. TaxID=507699 RepID=UPI00261CDF6B|nr:MBOAT family O-acyltransferase [uncultured Kordia sp.]
MLFNSIDFAVFFPIVIALYWLLAKNIPVRNIFLLLTSYLFYGWWDYRFLSLIALSSIVDYVLGQQIHKASEKSKKKLYLILSLCVNLGLLVYFKYANFFIETFVDAFSLFGSTIEASTLNIILPVGISFYTFQTLSYTIDVYKGKLEPTKNIINFFAFVSFFPQLVAGPIERASHLLPQFSVKHKFSYTLFKSGMLLMAFGLFKKMVIADRLSVYVNEVFNNPTEYGGIEIIIGTIFFAFQIYCDFSGYSDIAIGIARTMGFDLMKNFDSPYFSKSITEFWRRWHISLSTWFRDYVYIPLGGSKKGSIRTYANLFIVFVVSGLWHGAAMTFIIWGVIHGFVIVFEKASMSFRQKIYKGLGLDKKVFSNRLFFGIITFIIVCFAWIFFRANSLNDAITLISNMFTVEAVHNIYEIGWNRLEFDIAILSIVALLSLEYINSKKNLYKLFNRQSYAFRWVSYVVMILVILVYRSVTVGDFIYFQF